MVRVLLWLAACRRWAIILFAREDIFTNYHDFSAKPWLMNRFRLFDGFPRLLDIMQKKSSNVVVWRWWWWYCERLYFRRLFIMMLAPLLSILNYRRACLQPEIVTYWCWAFHCCSCRYFIVSSQCKFSKSKFFKSFRNVSAAKPRLPCCIDWLPEDEYLRQEIFVTPYLRFTAYFWLYSLFSFGTAYIEAMYISPFISEWKYATAAAVISRKAARFERIKWLASSR